PPGRRERGAAPERSRSGPAPFSSAAGGPIWPAVEDVPTAPRANPTATIERSSPPKMTTSGPHPPARVRACPVVRPVATSLRLRAGGGRAPGAGRRVGSGLGGRRSDGLPVVVGRRGGGRVVGARRRGRRPSVVRRGLGPLGPAGGTGEPDERKLETGHEGGSQHPRGADEENTGDHSGNRALTRTDQPVPHPSLVDE